MQESSRKGGLEEAEEQWNALKEKSNHMMWLASSLDFPQLMAASEGYISRLKSAASRVPGVAISVFVEPIPAEPAEAVAAHPKVECAAAGPAGAPDELAKVRRGAAQKR